MVDSTALLYHGPHGLGTFTGAPPAGAAVVEGVTGAEFLLDVVTRRLVGQVSVLVFSPPTSLAQALSMAPHAFTRSVKSVHLMGGALKGPGNVTPLAESNFHQDSLAADAVIRAFQELGYGDKLVLAPLDVTLQAAFSQDELNARLTHGAGQWWARDVCPYYIAMYSGITAGMPMHDVHPLAQLLHPEWYVGVRPRGLRVETAAGGGGAALGMLYHDARHWASRVSGGAKGSGSDSDPDSNSGPEVVVAVAVEGGGDPVRDPTLPILPLVLLEVDADSFKEWVLSLLSAI
jgi:inosine-uridine nucleoside N-ribohydrolase